MITKRIFGSPRHEHAEPATRALGAAELPPDSVDLARLLTVDPAPEVRAAAAARCADVDALASGAELDTDVSVGPFAVIGEATEGTLARFIQNRLSLMMWYRSPRAPTLVFGAQLKLAQLIQGLHDLIHTPPRKDLQAIILEQASRAFGGEVFLACDSQEIQIK